MHRKSAFTAGLNNTEFTIDDNDNFKANGIGSSFEIEFSKPILKNLIELITQLELI